MSNVMIIFTRVKLLRLGLKSDVDVIYVLVRKNQRWYVLGSKGPVLALIGSVVNHSIK